MGVPQKSTTISSRDEQSNKWKQNEKGWIPMTSESLTLKEG